MSKSTGTEIEVVITSKTFDLDTIPKEEEVVIPIQVVFKANILSDSMLDKLKTRVVVRGDKQ